MGWGRQGRTGCVGMGRQQTPQGMNVQAENPNGKPQGNRREVIQGKHQQAGMWKAGNCSGCVGLGEGKVVKGVGGCTQWGPAGTSN